jgi:methyl-accepting chemotaxis protein
MKWFKDLKTSVKLISAFILLGIVLGAVGIYGIFNLNKMDSEMNFMYKERLIPISDISSGQVMFQRIRVNIRDMNFNDNTPQKNKEYEDIIKGLQQDIQVKIDKYGQTILTSKEKKLVADFAPAMEEYNGYLTKAYASGYKHDLKAYKAIVPDFKQSGDKVEGVLQELIDFNLELGKQSSEESNALASSARTITITVVIISILFSIAFGYVIAQLIARPLREVVGLVGKVAEGDLTVTTKIDTKDEVGELAKSINNMVGNLRQTVGSILSSAENVSASAQEISATTEEVASSASTQAHGSQVITELFREIAKGADGQANDAQTMSELFKELSHAIDSVAQNAEHSAELAEQMLKVSQDSGKVVQSSIDGMTQVNEQMALVEQDANKIGDIINVIDDIASQTNLLALNAAIEAARAGEQGKGFAVVATEVRKLAERSGEATKEIASIVSAMQENTKRSVLAVTKGVESTQKTEEAFETISSMVSQTASRVTEIAAASEEQSAQSNEVMKSIESIASASEQQSSLSDEAMRSIESIAEASQEAAAASEQTAATSQSLADLAEQLNTSVSIFKV